MEITVNEALISLKQLLGKKPEQIVLVAHENPDGDAVGSAVGLAEMLKNQGHETTVLVPNDFPRFLKWFSSKTEIIIYSKNKKEAKERLNNAGILFCVDFNEPKRAGHLEKKIIKFDKPKVLIDHHPNPSEFVDFMISEPGYSSTAELIFDVAGILDIKKYLNREAAEALYTGIMTDTGSFSYNTNNSNTFKVVAELITFGINTDEIQSKVYHNFSADRMRMLGHCLKNNMEVFSEYRSAVIYISKLELGKYEYQPGDTEGFVNYPLSINNIVFSALFIEQDGFVKASFRSKGTFPANEFSRSHFEGGGHRNAAGGESKLKLNETVEKFRKLLEQYKQQLVTTEI